MKEKILFINSGHSDYLEDLIFAGLTEILGGDRIIPFPINYRYYFARHPYPKNIGECRSSGQFAKDLLKQALLGVSLRDIDLVVIGSAKKNAFTSYLKVASKLSKNVPVAFIDGGDREEIGGDADRLGWKSIFDQARNLRAFDVIFKREMIPGRDYAPNIYPLPLAYKMPASPLPKIDKKHDVAFWCVESHPIRTQALKILEPLYDCKRNGTKRGQTFTSYSIQGLAYLQELAACKVAINFRGGGWDTLRYWEIPGVGSFMLSGKPGMIIPHDFVHEQHAVFCRDDLSDFTDLIDYYLKNEKEREEIAASGHLHMLKHHSHLARTRQFIDIVTEELGRCARKAVVV